MEEYKNSLMKNIKKKKIKSKKKDTDGISNMEEIKKNKGKGDAKISDIFESKRTEHITEDGEKMFSFEGDIAWGGRKEYSV